MVSIRNLLFSFVKDKHLSVADHIVLKIEFKKTTKHSTREMKQGQYIIIEIKI